MSKKRIIYTLTYKGRPLMALFVAPTKDGVVFGMETPQGEEAHLTLVPTEKGMFGSHITDRSKQIQQPWDTHFSPELIGEKIGRITKPWVRELHANHIAWVMTPYLKEKVRKAAYLHVGQTEVRSPLEVMMWGQIIADFENPKRWKRVKIRDLTSMKEGIAFRLEDGAVKYVFPAGKANFLCCSERQYWKFRYAIFQLLGFENYFDYVGERYRRRVRRRLRDILKETRG